VPRLEPLDALHARLNRLMDSWNGPNAESGSGAPAFLGTDIMGSLSTDDASSDRLNNSQAFSASSHLSASTYTEMHAGARSHANVVHPPRPPLAANEVSERMVSFRLAGLLALLLKNIEDLTPESALVGNQIEQIGRVLTAPLTEKKLDEAERCVRALVVRQGAIKHSIDETKRAIRDLAESLIEKMASLVTSTDGYATKVVDIAEQIAATNDLGKLSDLTRVLVADARALSANVGAERALLVEAQERSRALQERTASLERELSEASTLVRTDPLTRAMNRRGFNDAYKAELASVEHGGKGPSIVLLDVDNFKRINEQHGHSVGDEVLCQLVEVLQRCAASGATVSRYGGEEFALMFPQLAADDAELAVVKMQRALLDHLSSGPSHLPTVTFSAGVARVESQESLADVITRADRALRLAKQAGKNCIVVASSTPAEQTSAA
jgi:diguanylate cyclase